MDRALTGPLPIWMNCVPSANNEQDRTVAEVAEREVVKLQIEFSCRTNRKQLDAVITGVAEYGFYAQGTGFPAEGLVHISSLSGDYYHYDEASHTLEGVRSYKRYRLGDRVRVEVVRADLQRRQLDFRVIADGLKKEEAGPPKKQKKRRD